jgi:hypothetical protein
MLEFNVGANIMFALRTTIYELQDIEIMVSAGGLKLNQKQKRYTRYIKRKKGNGKIKKIKVVVDNPKWVSHSLGILEK